MRTSANHICVYNNCFISNKVCKDVSFFKFPVKNCERAEEWKRNCGNLQIAQMKLESLKNKLICEKHFLPVDFIINSKRKLLRRTAVPIKFVTDDFESKHVPTLLPFPAAEDTSESSEPMKVLVTASKRSYIDLRDASRGPLKRRKMISGKKTKWEYEELMCVLRPYFQDKTALTNTEIASVLLSGNDEDNADEVREMPESTTGEAEERTEVEPPLEQTAENSKASANSIDLFLSAIGITMKSFSPYYQNIAKQRIFSVVSELELKEITS